MAKETLKQRIDAGAFVITCELTPPKGTDLVPLFEKAELLRNLVHAFNLTESHSARMAMEPTAVAHLLLDQRHRTNRANDLTRQESNRNSSKHARSGCSWSAKSGFHGRRPAKKW